MMTDFSDRQTEQAASTQAPAEVSFAQPSLPVLPTHFTKPAVDGSFTVEVIPGYHASLWRDSTLDRQHAVALGIYFPRIDEGFFVHPELLSNNEVGMAVVGDMVVGVETLQHYTERRQAQVDEVESVIVGMKRAAQQQGKGAGNEPYMESFEEGQKVTQLRDLTDDMNAARIG